MTTKLKSYLEQLSYEQKLKLYELFSEYGSRNKKDLFDNNIHQRTKHISILLENVYFGQNASAVVRTCDCFGVQDIHMVENVATYQADVKIAMGASKWVNSHTYNSIEESYAALQKKGYKVVATTPHNCDCLLEELPIEEPMVLVFGNEKDGISDYAVSQADIRMKIPMYGFTESLNVSVSAALCLHHLIEKLRKSSVDWQLTEKEKIDLKLSWLHKSVRSAEEVLDVLINRHF